MRITEHAIVACFGALVSGIGLVLLFLRKEQARNRIRLFGQDLQISTPDLVVFLVGSAIFILPLIMPIKNETVIDIRFPWQSELIHSNTESNIAISGEEKEPNDQITAANLMTIDEGINGSIATPQDRDFFKFRTVGQEPRTPGQAPKKIRVILRKASLGGFWAAIVVYDEVEKKISERDEHGEDPISLVFDAMPNSYYYILVKPGSTGSGGYQLVVKQE
jgi:hypothetical protein